MKYCQLTARIYNKCVIPDPNPHNSHAQPMKLNTILVTSFCAPWPKWQLLPVTSLLFSSVTLCTMQAKRKSRILPWTADVFFTPFVILTRKWCLGILKWLPNLTFCLRYCRHECQLWMCMYVSIICLFVFISGSFSSRDNASAKHCSPTKLNWQIDDHRDLSQYLS